MSNTASPKASLVAALEDWRTNAGQHGCTPESVVEALDAFVESKLKSLTLKEEPPSPTPSLAAATTTQPST